MMVFVVVVVIGMLLLMLLMLGMIIDIVLRIRIVMNAAITLSRGAVAWGC